MDFLATITAINNLMARTAIKLTPVFFCENAPFFKAYPDGLTIPVTPVPVRP